MQVGDLVQGVDGVNALGCGIIVERKIDGGDRVVVILQKGGPYEAAGHRVETRASYRLWEVISKCK